MPKFESLKECTRVRAKKGTGRKTFKLLLIVCVSMIDSERARCTQHIPAVTCEKSEKEKKEVLTIREHALLAHSSTKLEIKASAQLVHIDSFPIAPGQTPSKSWIRRQEI